jgi:long-chain acyl-CoA synthetase
VMHAAVEACCVTGANLGQPLALLMLNMDAAQRALDAAERSALEASLAAHLKSINALLDPHERLDCLVVVTQPWTVESGLITPTFKVRRNRVEDLYAPHYERWVVERRAVIWHQA